MQSFIEFSAAQGIQPDFISYHLFGNAPEQNRRANRQVLDLLSANGFAPLPIIVGSWNPLDACYEPNEQRDDPSWPSPPSALGCWQTDNEMGASYSLAFMAHLAEGGVAGYQAMYQLDDADWGGSEEFPHDWGLRTNKNKHGLRKAIYHAQTIVGRMPRTLVSVSAAHANGADEYFPHVYALAGVEGDRLSVLLWSYVTSPGRQAVEVLRDMGYGPADFARWGGQTRIAAFLTGAIPVSAVTSVASEQTDLERMKVVFYRQRALVTETSHVSLAIDGFASTGGYRVKRWLIDATHNNTYGTYVASGLNAAIATERLQQLDTQLVTAALADPGRRPRALCGDAARDRAGRRHERLRQPVDRRRRAPQPAQAASAVGRRSAQAPRHRRGADEPADRPGRARPAPRPHHQRRRRPRRPHCPRGIELVGERRRHDVEVSRPVGVERHRQREGAGDQAGRHAAREAEGPRPRARRRAGGHAAGGDDRVRGADSGAGTVRRHGVRGVPDDGERGDDAVSVKGF